MPKARIFVAQCDDASPETIKSLLQTGLDLLSQGDIHDGPGFRRLTRAVQTGGTSPTPRDPAQHAARSTQHDAARPCETSGDLDAPGLPGVGRSIDLHG